MLGPQVTGICCPQSPSPHSVNSAQKCSQDLRPRPTAHTGLIQSFPPNTGHVLSLSSLMTAIAVGQSHTLWLGTEVPAGPSCPPLFFSSPTPTPGHSLAKECVDCVYRGLSYTLLPGKISSSFKAQFACHFFQEATPDCLEEY